MHNKSALIFISIFLALPHSAPASDDWRDIRTGENTMLYWTDAVSIRASWTPAKEYLFPRTPKVNVTEIRCTRQDMKCEEVQAKVEQRRNSEPSSSPAMNVFAFTYEVRSWEPKSITAVRINPNGLPVDEVLTIDMAHGIVQKVWKDKPNSDGYFKPSEQTFEFRVEHPMQTEFAR